MSTPSVPRSTSTLETTQKVLGPWSLPTSKLFWEGFTPSALAAQEETTNEQATIERAQIRSVFLCDSDWQRVETVVTQNGSVARISVIGQGNLEDATAQVSRFLSLDIDAREWPQVGRADPVIANAQAQLPGLRPCGFRSPYEAAVWAVLSQRVQMRQAAKIKADLQDRYGDNGAFPAPDVLRGLSLDLPGRKAEYLHAVAESALEGRLAGSYLRSIPAHIALQEVQQILGLGPFAAELVVIRGANFADVLPHNEHRLNAEIVEQYGAERPAAEIVEAWRPFRSWAAVHLRALREMRTHEIAG